MRQLFSSIKSIAGSSRKFLTEHNLEPFPLRHSLKRYSRRKFSADLFAGTNVALMAIPQSMAFAVLAGLDNVVYGITCNAIACLVAPFFASSRMTSVGPTNASALMVYSALAGTGLAAAERTHLLPVLVFMAGVILVVGAYLRMADLIQYISRSVVVGYVTGVGCLDLAGQLRETVGIPALHGVGPKARGFLNMLGETFSRWREIELNTVIASVLTLVIYLLLRKFARRLPSFAITMFGVSLIVWILEKFHVPLGLTHVSGFDLSSVMPAVPDFRDGGTFDHMSLLFGPAMAIAFLAALENSVTAKGLAGRTGDRPDPNQDLLSVGMGNLGAAFVSQMPVSGSLTRSAFNYESGAVTQISSLVTGVICAVGAIYLGHVVTYIPKCSLAVLIMAISMGLFNLRHISICLNATRSDAITLVMTLLATLLMPLHVAIFIGVATSVILYLRKASRPSLVEYSFNNEGDLTEKGAATPRHFPQISIVHVEGELFFGAAELFRTQIQRTVVDTNLRVIILRMKNARHLDATSVMALEDLIVFLRSKGRHLIISGASKSVYRVLRDSKMIEVIGRENLFVGSAQNPNLSTRNALKRAQVLLGTKDAEVKIYYDPHQAPAAE